MGALYDHEKSSLASELSEASKRDVLAWLLPSSIQQEIIEIGDAGYDISIGSTEDRAYEDPSSIEAVYDMLDEKGNLYSKEMGKFDAGRYALLSTVRFGAPTAPARDWAKSRLKKREAKAEELRSRLLYDLIDVQGQPWHRQGGKALALGTIVDAYNLRVQGEKVGLFDTMSGRLSDKILDYTFEDNSGWLSGLNLESAVIEANMRFKGNGVDRAEQSMRFEVDHLSEFVSVPVRSGFKDIVTYCSDSLGIRSRKEEVHAEIDRYVDESDKDSFTMMSVGCGTALPMLEVIAGLRDKGKEVQLILLDQDPIALAAAEQFAEQMGLKDCLEIYCEQLFHGKGRNTRLLDLQTILKGRELDVCEDSGLREYFPDFLYKDLTKQAWNSLADDGIMTTGNMNKNRPQAEFLHGLMGWPIPVQMRKISEIAKLHAEAGIPKSASRLRVTQDGVYTLCFSSKSKS